MKNKTYFLLIIGIITLIQIIAVIPGLASENANQIFSLDEIVVIASKYPEKILDSVASVEVISEEEIKAAQAENLADILSTIAGLEINDYGDAAGIKSISIRGSSTEQVLIMLDGRPMNDPQTGQIDLGQIPASIIEKIEIYRGPASAIYGANALGGVINIITKKGEGESIGEVKANFGTYQTRDYELSYQRSNEDLNYFLFGKYLTTEGSRENSQMDEINLLGKIDIQLDQQTNMDFTLQYNSYQREVPGSLTYLTPQATQDDQYFNFNSSWQRKTEDKDISVVIYNNYHKLTYDDPEEWGYTGTSIHKTNRTGLSLNCTDYDFSLNGEGSDGQHIFTWGTEVIMDRVNSNEIGEHETLNGAVFAQEVWQPEDLDDLKLTLGTRYDYNQIYGGQLNPRIGISYRVADEINFHASIGRAYRAPTFDDLYWPSTSYVSGNPDLVPETAWAYEAGLRYMNEAGDCKGEFNLFRKNVNNLINWASGDDGIWIPSNIDSARVDGLEVILEKDLGDHLRANLGYTYLNAVNLNTDDQLKPHHKYNFGFGYYDTTGDHQDELSVRLEGYAVTERPGDLPNYCLIDLNIGKELTLGGKDDHKIKLEFSLKNILDQQPEIVNGYPINGRTYSVGLSFEF
ncbi:MAG: TonB-dependent receptor [Atribacterota bacterium]|nr:TonB-dependent receptor [Atribacterota bacterium]